MKTSIHILSYLAQFFLEWEVFQLKVVEKIKTHILMLNYIIIIIVIIIIQPLG